jgi:hypothetical protein
MYSGPNNCKVIPYCLLVVHVRLSALSVFDQQVFVFRGRDWHGDHNAPFPEDQIWLRPNDSRASERTQRLNNDQLTPGLSSVLRRDPKHCPRL